MTEMHGAIPLPPGKVHVHYDPLTGIETAQQPQAQQVAVFEASPNDDCFNGAMIDVNQHFVVYAVKNGLIRVLHRHSSLRSLLRFHEGHIVTDIAFFQSGDVLGTVGGHVAIWRLFEKSNQIVAEVLLEIPDRLPSVSRLIWHPFNPNQFWLFHEDLTGTRVATLVETTRIATVAGNHAVCQMFSDDVVMEGAVRIAGADVTDLCWSGRDTRHVLTVHSDGTIRFWDIKSVDVKPSGTGTVSPLCKFVVEERVPQYRCLFLPHENASTENGTGQSATLTTCFCTSSKQNSCVTLWTPFTEDASPTKIQVFSMDQANLSYNLSVCHGPMTAAAEIPPAFFVVLSDRREGKLFCLSLKSLWSQHEPRRPLVHGFDYIVPFQTKYPTYSWSVMCGPAEHLEESAPTGGLNFDIRFYALQSKMVQQLTLSHYMCLPPAGEWVEGTSGVWSEPLVPNLGKFVVDFDEDYALDEIGSYAEEDDFAAPDASSLPQPIPEPTKDKDQSNPFANWLGALATKSTMVEPSKEIDPIAAAAPPTTPAAALVQGTAGGTMNALPDQPTGKGIPGFLSPMDLLSPPVKNVGSSSGHGKATETQRRTEGRKSSKSPKREKSPQRKHRKLHVDNKIAILKRDQNTAASSPPQIATQPDDKVPSSISEENLKNALVTHQKQQEKHILQVVKRTVREEIQTSVIPELCKAVGQMIDNATNQSLRQSVEQAMERGATLKESDIQKQIASNVEQTLKETFSEVSLRLFVFFLLPHMNADVAAEYGARSHSRFRSSDARNAVTGHGRY